MRSNRKIAAIVITVILAISTFPLLMVAASEETDSNLTEAVDVIIKEENAPENNNIGKQTSSGANVIENIQ